jgi:hypothetical protein
VRNASRHPVWAGYPAAVSVSSQGELFACP